MATIGKLRWSLETQKGHGFQLHLGVEANGGRGLNLSA